MFPHVPQHTHTQSHTAVACRSEQACNILCSDTRHCSPQCTSCRGIDAMHAACTECIIEHVLLTALKVPYGMHVYVTSLLLIYNPLINIRLVYLQLFWLLRVLNFVVLQHNLTWATSYNQLHYWNVVIYTKRTTQILSQSSSGFLLFYIFNEIN